MQTESNKVLRRPAPLTENLYRDLVSNAVFQVGYHRGIIDPELAEKTGASERTISNARNKSHSLNGKTLFNLLSVDDLALEGLLHHFGRRSVPIEAKCDTDALVSTSGAVHKLAMAHSAVSEDRSRVTDRECLDMEPEIDAAIAALSALKNRCHKIRSAA